MSQSAIVKKFNEEFGAPSAKGPTPLDLDAPPPLPYMYMNYDGHTLFVKTILESQEKALKLIAAMTAMVPFLPPSGDA
jgi:hypothetical protein